MRSRRAARRGSALLIVLGFLSFMVVSAVAFSIYMRSQRVPSSAFRRTEATRFLVKAALAQAISQVDDAIRDDPFPGVISQDSHHRLEGNSWSDANNNSGYYDKWLGRVFMPPEPLGDDQKLSDLDEKDRLVPSDRMGETVPVLNLEALGYLPPALINDVRYLSRLSWAAKWQYFNFDAGRYAYCAVNVSDFFDINRVGANGVRTSANPISLSYLFASGNSYDSNAAKGLEDFTNSLKQARSSTADYPFISLLDYNLAMGSVNKLNSPFFNYIGQKNASIYDGFDENKLARQYFLTDSWFRDCNTNLNERTLMNCDHNSMQCGQPFADLSKAGRLDVDTLYSSSLPGGLAGSMHVADRVSLYDYMDRDDVPTSLAMPTTERVPMIVGVEPRVGLNVKVEAGAENPDPSSLPAPTSADGTQETTTPYHWGSDTLTTPSYVKTALTFPFKRGDDLNDKKFRVQAMARIYLTDPSVSGSAIRNVDGALRMANLKMGDTTLRPAVDDWKLNGETVVGDHFISVLSDPFNVSLPTVGDSESSAQIDVNVNFQPSNGDLQNNPLFELVRVYKAKKTGVDANDQPIYAWEEDASQRKVRAKFVPISANGSLPFASGTEFKVDDAKATTEFVPSVAVWVRVIDQDSNNDGKKYTVDYVPANVADDDLNNINNVAIEMILQKVCGNGVPLLRFTPSDTSAKIVYSDKVVDSASGQNVDWLPKALYAPDPRYNFAPEDWLEASGSISGSGWLSIAHQLATGQNGRDPDIFLFVSNQGYLQSMTELSFLPRLGDLSSSAINPFGNKDGGYDGKLRSNNSSLANYNLMWKTYHPYDVEGEGTDDLFDFGITDGISSAFRVNPYTDNATVFAAALANTPYDWWAAGTNDAQQVAGYGQNPVDYQTKKAMLKSIDESFEYAFNDKSSEAKLSYDEVNKIAAVIQNKIRENPTDWKAGFDSLDWFGDNENDFLGVNVSKPLHAVDRKYLYGFWRNCFANQQQLFLIFVRAEQTSIGGTGEGAGTPAQLGGRAVALVWRDPTGNSDDKRTTTPDHRPHKTRILFYHQFD